MEFLYYWLLSWLKLNVGHKFIVPYIYVVFYSFIFILCCDYGDVTNVTLLKIWNILQVFLFWVLFI